MLIPGIIILILLYYLPMAGIIIAFKNINYRDGILGSPWIGFRNFRFMFATDAAWVMTRNTILYNGFFIISGTVTSVGFALLLNEIRRKIFARFYQTIILAPHFLSMVVVGYLVFIFLGEQHGFINNYLLPWLGKEAVGWYREPLRWIFILPIVNLWKGVGYGTIIYLAAIVGVDKELFEAAAIDGASRLKQIWHITLPAIRPVMIILLIMSIGKIFYSDFGLFYNATMNTGTLIPTTQVIDTFVYRSLLSMGNIGMSSAAAFYQSVVGFVLVLTSNWVVKKLDPDSALF